MLQDLRLSVGRTWRFVTSDDAVTVSEDLSGYRRQIDMLKNESGGDGFRLPWPAEYSSRLWRYMFGDDYTSTPSKRLVCGLLPLLRDDMVQPRSLESPPGTVLAWLDPAEAFRHPFAVTVVLNFSRAGGRTGPGRGAGTGSARQPCCITRWSTGNPARCATGRRFPCSPDCPPRTRTAMTLGIEPGQRFRLALRSAPGDRPSAARLPAGVAVPEDGH